MLQELDQLNTKLAVINTAKKVKEVEKAMNEKLSSLSSNLERVKKEPGPQGDKGEKGDPGKDGVDGKPGNDGVKGIDGKDGANGLNGLDGKDGKPGKIGPKGPNGDLGKPGKDGKDGLDGSPDTGKQIIQKINTEKVARIDASRIKNLSQVIALGGKQGVTGIASADGSITVTNPTTTPDLAVVKAPKLSTARTIAGVSFDGTANISLDSSTTVTTTGNIDDLNFTNVTLIRMNNATAATIRGLLAGVDGQVVTIVSIGAGNVFFANQNTNSTAANRLINFVTSGITPLAAGKGTATFRYDATTARWRLISHEQGAPINQPYVSTDYTTDAGTWTVDLADINTFAYTIRGKKLQIDFTATNTSISSALATRMEVLIPNGYTYTREARQPAFVFNGGTSTTGMARSVASATQMFIYRDPGVTNYATATDTSNFFASFESEIN